MKRRSFLQLSAIGGVTIPGLALTGCTNSSVPSEAVSGPPPFDLEEYTVDQLQEAMASGQLTARAIAEKYLARIEAIDQGEIDLRSVVEANPDALSIADAMDQERKAGKVRGPLHGIPVLIKENIDTADKMMTTAGSLALHGHIAQADSWVAARLREAGAVILGKTNLSEWANFRSSRSSSGWSSRGGQTRNPYALDRNPCGSSSGSGAAVAANLCAMAIGTETNGSIISPSSLCGLVGIKPTVGLVGRSGIIPISHTQDTAGPMTRSVRDAAILLGALTGIDPRDAVTRQSQGKSHSDYTAFLDPNGLKGARIGVDRSAMGFHEVVDKLIEDALQVMREQGAYIIDLEKVADPAIDNDEYQVLLYEFKDGVNKYLEGVSPALEIKNLSDVIAYNKANSGKAMPFFGQETLIKAEAKGDLNALEYKKALENILRATREQGIDKVMTDNKLDAIVAPSDGPAWTTDVVNGDRYISGGKGYGTAAIAGYPNITVPAGFVYGLPVGISFYGRAYSEPVLLKLAYAFEHKTRHRKAPAFAKTLDELI